MSVVVPEKIPNLFISTFKVAMKMNKQTQTPKPKPKPTPTPSQSPTTPPTTPPLDFSNGSRTRGFIRRKIIVLEIHQLPKRTNHPNRRGVRKERRRK